jgi:hypothetical protein
MACIRQSRLKRGNAMNDMSNDPCDFAKQHYLNVQRWLNLWNILVFAFGVAVVLFLVTSILLFINSTWLPGAVTTIGTIASGTAVAWVVNQKKAASDDEKEAYDRIKEECVHPSSGPSSGQRMGFMSFATLQEPSALELKAELKKQAWDSLGFRGKRRK